MSGRSLRNHAREAAYAAVVALLLFASLAAAVMARHLVSETYPEYLQPFVAWLPDNVPAGLAIMAVFSALIGIGLYLFLTRFEAIAASLADIGPLRWLALELDARSVLRASLVIAVLWLPIVIIMYPTGLTADTFNQLYQFQTSAPTFYPTTGTLVDAEFIDHHPVFDTLLYGAFWQLGNALGSQNAGLFTLAVLQSAILAVELGFLTCYLSRLSVPYALRVATLALFAWFPFFAHYASTVLKDTTYLTVFVPWMIMWVEIARTRGRALDDARFLVAFMALGGFCTITKKLGVFLLVPCLVVLLIALRGQRARFATASTASLLVFCIAFPSIAYPAIGGVAPGGKQEALGPAIQQVTALLKEEPDALSVEEKEGCAKVFDVDRAVGNYVPFRSDAAKSTYLDSASDEDVVNFLRIWASAGMKHPDTYLVSAFETSGMLYVPFMKITYYSGEDLSGRAANYAKLNPGFAVSVGQPENLVELNDYLEFDSIECKISDLPVISLFFTEGFYGGWIPLIALALTLFARRRRAEGSPLYLTALFPIMLSALLLTVSPVASPRYMLPLLFTTPLSLGWAWFALSEQVVNRK